jgi:hypothetical protein
MHLGVCQQRLGIPIIRNNRFHQARPEDYNRTMLIRQARLEVNIKISLSLMFKQSSIYTESNKLSQI